MRWISLGSCACFAWLAAACKPSSPSGCGKDTDCIDGRICVSGQCTSPGTQDSGPGDAGTVDGGASDAGSVPPSLVQEAGPYAGTGPSGSCGSIATTAGDQLVILGKTCGTAMTVTDSQGDAFQEVTATANATANGVHAFLATRIDGGPTVVTVGGGTGTCWLAAHCSEWTHLSAIDTGSGVPYGSGAVVQTGLLNPGSASATAAALVIGASEVESTSATVGASIDYGAGRAGAVHHLTPAQTSALGGMVMKVDYEIVTDTGSHGFQSTVNPATNRIGGIASFSTVCAATSCGAQGKNCDSIPDGCGGTLPCGACSGTDTCGGGGVPNLCGTPGAGIVPFTPHTIGGVTYGAGGTALPALNNPHTYSCTSGDNTAGLQSALGQAGDVQILGATCQINGTVNVPSNKNIQCRNSATVLYNPTTGLQPSMLLLTSVSNVSISNCTLAGANTTAPPFYPGATTTGAPGSFSFLINGQAANTNVTIVDNVFLQPVGQAAVEFYGGTGAATMPSGINVSWNDFKDCALYGPTFDNVGNSHIDHNWAFDCIVGNELDGANQSLPNTTVNANYATRDQWGDGYGYICGQNPADPGCQTYFNWLGCGSAAAGAGGDYSGCTCSGNTVDGAGHGMNLAELHTLQGNYSNNTCVNGCTIRLD